MAVSHESDFFAHVAARDPNVARALRELAAEADRQVAPARTRWMGEDVSASPVSGYTRHPSPAAYGPSVSAPEGPPQSSPARSEASSVWLLLGALAWLGALGLIGFAFFMLWKWRDAIMASVYQQRDVLLYLLAAVGLSALLLYVSRAVFARLAVVAAVPPAATTDKPLDELHRFADESAGRLRTTYRVSLTMAVSVHAVLIGLVLWAVWLVSTARETQGAVFGAGGVGGMVMHQKWQPFAKVQEAGRLANEAEVMALGLRARLAEIALLATPAQRQRAQWVAVKDYLAASRPGAATHKAA